MDTADLREGVYDHLVSTITDVGGRVFWEYTTPADTEKPLLEMAFVGDLPSINSPLGMFIQLEILVFGEEGDILSLDPIADSVVSNLHNTNVTTPKGRVIRPEYKRDSRFDWWNETLKANIIRLKFWIPTDFWT